MGITDTEKSMKDLEFPEKYGSTGRGQRAG